MNKKMLLWVAVGWALAFVLPPQAVLGGLSGKK